MSIDFDPGYGDQPFKTLVQNYPPPDGGGRRRFPRPSNKGDNAPEEVLKELKKLH